MRARYKANPEGAWVTDHARTSSIENSDPFHATVEPMTGCGVVVPVGVHAALGGPHDAPTPGDLLCAALGACQDSAIRMVANMLGVEIEFLEVHVTAEADVRGALAMNINVPVGFQAITCDVCLRAKQGTNPVTLAKLQAAAERSRVVLQTLRKPPPVAARFHS